MCCVRLCGFESLCMGVWEGLFVCKCLFVCVCVCARAFVWLCEYEYGWLKG